MSQPIFPSVDPTTGRLRPSHLPEEAVTSDLGVRMAFTTDPWAVPQEGELLFLLAPPQSQFFTDFTSDTIGAPPTEWSPRWAKSSPPETLLMVEDVDALGGIALQMSDNGPDRQRAVVWDRIPALADVEIVFRWKGSAATAPRALLRAGEDSIRGYSGGVYNSSALGPATGLHRLGSPSTELGLQAFSFSPSTWYITRMRTVGTTIATKTWLASEQEPAGWDLEAQDTGATSGLAGFRMTGLGGVRTIDWVGVGLYGDTAPMEAVE